MINQHSIIPLFQYSLYEAKRLFLYKLLYLYFSFFNLQHFVVDIEKKNNIKVLFLWIWNL